MKPPFFLLTLLILVSVTKYSVAQVLYIERSITIDASAEVVIPADIVHFNIQLTVTADAAGEAFRLHKEKESFLAELIKKEGLQNENLSFQPVSLNSSATREGTARYSTMQSVSLTLTDFTLFERIQQILVENGFTNFRGSFNSSERQKGEEEALRQAIANARQKANIIAESLEKTITSIKTVEHHASPVTYALDSRSLSVSAMSSSMFEFEQTIKVSSQIRIVFEIY
jgi:uncharacterized protein YggE